MKILSIALSFCFMVNSFAASVGSDQLDHLLDEYQYAVTVEWDQQDKAYYEQQTAKFLSNVQEMIKAKAITSTDIMEVAESKGLQKAKIQNLLQASDLQNEKNPEQLAKMLMENSHLFYQEGSSWAPSAGAIFGYGALILIFVGLLAMGLTSANTTCTFSHYEEDYDEIWDCELDEDQLF